jgi:hypothetical protein
VEADVSWGNCNLQASDCLGEIDMDRKFSARFKSNQTMLVSARSDQRPSRRFGAASSVQAYDGSGSGGACAEARQGRQDRSIGTAIRQARVQVIGNVVREFLTHETTCTNEMTKETTSKIIC